MLKMTASQKRLMGWFTFAIALAIFFSSNVIQMHVPFHDVHTYLYAGLVIAWGFLVHQRIVNRQVRVHLVAASAFMLVLFISRLARWRCFHPSAFAQEYAWYAYYVSFAAVPLCTFLAGLCVGKEEKDRPLRRARWLWIGWLAFVVVAFTNSWHGWFFRFEDAAKQNYTYGPAYYVCVSWGVILAIATMVIIVRRCQVTTARKLWFIPMAGMLFFGGLIAWYYLSGGSPEFRGIKIYNIQEVFCMIFIFPFESMIQLGIMPNNSRYALFFENLPISAAILDEEGTIVYASKAQGHGEDAWKDQAGFEQASGNAGAQARRSEKAIHGGRIVWFENLTVIKRLDDEIRKVTEELEEENELIRQENEIRSERISYETKNHLYDKIASAVREKALAIDAILTGLAKGATEGRKENGKSTAGIGDAARRDLIRAMVMGAYVKRMGNMMLITEEAKEVSTRELGSAVRESLEYFGLTGVPNDFQELGERLLPAKIILLSYELLEELLENEETIYSVLVMIDDREEYLFRILLDAESLSMDEGWRQKECSEVGARLTVEYVDETWRVSLLAEGERLTRRDAGACTTEGKEGES